MTVEDSFAQHISSGDPLRPAFAMFAVGWGANMFTPMLLVYAGALGETAASVMFGAYALGLIPSFLMGSQLSDRWGRRTLMRVVVVTSIVGSVVLLLADTSFALLVIGRIIIGLAAGAAFGPGTVWLTELNERSQAKRSASVLTALALTGGFALGPLSAGALAQWLVLPSMLPYVLHIALMLFVAPVIWTAPETAPSISRGRKPESGVGAALRNPLFLCLVLPTAPWVFASIAASIVVLPQRMDFGDFDIIASGGQAALTLLTGAAVQPLARRVGTRGLVAPYVGGLVLLCLGLLAGAATEVTGHPAALVVASVFLGAAYGFLLIGGLQTIPLVAPADDRSLLTGIFYVLAYSGYIWPILANLVDPVFPTSAMFLVSAPVAVLTLIPVWAVRRGRSQVRSGSR